MRFYVSFSNIPYRPALVEVIQHSERPVNTDVVEQPSVVALVFQR